MGKLNKVSISKTDVLLVCKAFMAYTGMYAVRKSFLAGQFEGVEAVSGFHFKTLLIIGQVLGYMLSKFIGIRLVPEIPPYKRFGAIVGLVGFGLLMLLAFAYVPIPLKPVTMFLNGLPLGMIFGLVLVYLEGRKNSELLAAGLSATFIFSTGLVKSTGIWLMQDFQINEWIMPFVTGAVFFPMLLIAAYGLNKSKPPTATDKELRTERVPMDKKARLDFIKKHGGVFLVLVLVYVLLTVVRDFRDNFIVEFWAAFNMSQQPELITLTELPIAILVLIISALGILVIDNKKAFLLGILATIISAILMIIVTFLFKQGEIGPVIWMIGSGFSVYLPYILFHCLLFERLLAFLKYKGTVGFLFYVADALGYLGSVGILIYKEFFHTQSSWVEFFTWLNFGSGALIVVLVFVLLWNIKEVSPKIQLK